MCVFGEREKHYDTREKRFVQEIVWFGHSLFLTVALSTFGELKYYIDSYTLMYTQTRTTQKENKKKKNQQNTKTCGCQKIM